jgi:PKD repeat protein
VQQAQSGSLTVTISPTGAASAGAKWNVDGGSTWYASGAVVPNLSVGSHTVAFSGVQGWTAPSSQTVTITNGQTASATGTYTAIFEANFAASRTSGKVPLTVHFTSSGSVGNITEWLWNFGDGHTSKLRNPSHTYSRAGAYTVTLTVAGPYGANTSTQPDYITVYARPKANFSAVPRSGDAPLQVNFTNESTGVFTSWLWHFGDGTTSTEENPTYTYNSPRTRTYTAKLTVYGPGGSSSKTLSIGVKK